MTNYILGSRRTSPITASLAMMCVACFWVLTACSDATSAPPTGVIEIKLTTSGLPEDLDPDGYSLYVDNRPFSGVATNKSLAVDVNAGKHAVRLDGVAPNCSINGSNELTIEVTGAQSVSAAFDITCVVNIGVLRLVTSTTGLNASSYSYTAIVPGIGNVGLGASDTLRFQNVRAGQLQITLGDISSNCLADGLNPRTVVVPFNDTAVVTFYVHCSNDDGTSGQIMRGQIVFLDPWDGAIFVADSTGRRLRSVSQSSGAADLAVSADGKNIAFSRPCTSLYSWCSHMYTMTADGRDILLLQTGDTLDQPSRPAWSPDGKRIAFDQGRLLGPHFDYRNIYTINADGTGVTQITHSGYNQWPAWSPDGRRIIFARSEDDPVTGLDYGIFEMAPDGSNVRRLRSGFRDRWPTWSPDGSRIAFLGLSPRDYVMHLFVMNADGSNARVLKSGLDHDERPAWSPDGKSITFVVRSASRMCEDIWDFGLVPCGQSAMRVGLDGIIYPWELPSASYLVWQR